MENNFSILIPARIGSTRLPNKPLIDLCGKTLIQRVYEQAKTISDEVYIATDSDLVLNHVISFTDNVVITSDKHISGTDRIYEAVKKLSIPKNKLIINLQGDEPFMPSELVQQIVSDYNSNDCDVITASHSLSSVDDLLNQNCVKVETNKNSFAKNFLREVNTKDLNLYSRHIGVYGYNLEILESL
jgi:3-deoxy-manno-octulosonate cytidylyltransferase (CMP-KDO synthetase)